jgi:hypothetical protein
VKKTALYKNGNVLSYAEYGDQNGDPILIQHGLIASINDSHLLKRLIETGAHLISVARPGYGDSSPYVMRNIAEWGEIVAVLVDKLGLSQFDVLGISSGAPYSYAIGYRFLDQVGIAQDLRIRRIDWGFPLSDVKGRVYMRHSKTDNSVPFITAELTSRLLPACQFEVRENDVHFSQEVLDDFVGTVMAGFHEK